jgi:hypothetical protein
LACVPRGQFLKGAWWKLVSLGGFYA